MFRTDTLTYSLDVKPEGATIDPQTGLIRWTPTEQQGPTQADFTVRVTDSNTGFDIQSFTVTVNEVNLPPIIDPIDDIETQPARRSR